MMKFRAKFLQSKNNIATSNNLNHIYDTYRKPDGRLEGEDEDLANAVRHVDEVFGRG